MAIGIIGRAILAVAMGVVWLAAFAGSAVAQPFLDTLVQGTVSGATSGTVSVYSNGTPCKTIAGGTIKPDGTYQIVVNCDAGTGTLYVDGAATSATFTLIPGTVSSDVNAAVGGATPLPAGTTPGASGTPAPGETPGATPSVAGSATATTTAEETAIAPRNGSSGGSSGSSHAWVFVLVGLGAVIALGAGGYAALRMRHKGADAAPP